METRAQLPPPSDMFVERIDHAVLQFTRHWLAGVNTALALVTGLPVLAAWLLAHGQHGLAHLIFLAYMPICHQRPERSFFLWGEQMAFCQRNTAIFVTILVSGLAFAVVRHYLQPPPWRVVMLLMAPMAIDGFTQLVGWRESTWELRVLTGSLFGLASAWLLYPHLEAGMDEMRIALEARRRGAGVR